MRQGLDRRISRNLAGRLARDWAPKVTGIKTHIKASKKLDLLGIGAGRKQADDEGGQTKIMTALETVERECRVPRLLW